MEKAFKTNKDAGYTLVELIVVIMIIGILASATVLGFSTYYNSQVDSAAEKLVIALTKTRQESINRNEGSVRMELYQDSNGGNYAKIVFHNGSSDQVLEEYKICGSLIKLSVKDLVDSITYLSYTASIDPTVHTAQEINFHFNKSTGGLIEEYKDIILEGSEIIDIIIIRETGRSFY